MIDKLILAPYYWTLRLRHKLYDCGAKRVHTSPVPTISVGNITVGGTGKTPHTELLTRLIADMQGMKRKNIAVLSRGHKRRSRGFAIVKEDSSARMYGDEPMQIKRKFPKLTVAVDKNRVRGCNILAEGIQGESAPADIILLDDAFQYRALKPSLSIVLVDSNRPVHKDHLLPIGNLRDIPERLSAADLVVITKCPPYMDQWERTKWAESLGYKGNIVFTTLRYDNPVAVFPEGDPHYIHSKRLIMFTGIADDSQFYLYLNDNYNIVRNFKFSDHHKFSHSDIQRIEKAAEHCPTAIIVTTEKDAQRLRDCKGIGEEFKRRVFAVPVRADFVEEQDRELFISVLRQSIRAGH